MHHWNFNIIRWKSKEWDTFCLKEKWALLNCPICNKRNFNPWFRHEYKFHNIDLYIGELTKLDDVFSIINKWKPFLFLSNSFQQIRLGQRAMSWLASSPCVGFWVDQEILHFSRQFPLLFKLDVYSCFSPNSFEHLKDIWCVDYPHILSCTRTHVSSPYILVYKYIVQARRILYSPLRISDIYYSKKWR